MGIHLNVISANGTVLTYGRVVSIEVDYSTREAKATIGGFTHISNKQGETPTPVMSTSYIMPDPPPWGLVAHAYEQLAATYTDIDFTEV